MNQSPSQYPPQTPYGQYPPPQGGFPPQGGYPPAVGFPPAPRRSRLGVFLLVFGILLIVAGAIVLLADPKTRNAVFPPAASATATRPPKTATPKFTPTPRATNTPQPTPTPELTFLGQWEYTDPSSGLTISFWFKPDGTLTVGSSGALFDLHYEIVDGDTLKILADESLGVTEGEMDYRVEGDTIYLTVDGDTQTMTRSAP